MKRLHCIFKCQYIDNMYYLDVKKLYSLSIHRDFNMVEITWLNKGYVKQLLLFLLQPCRNVPVSKRWLVTPTPQHCFVPSPPTNRSLSGKSMKAKLLLDQLRSLRGKVSAPKLCSDTYKYWKMSAIDHCNFQWSKLIAFELWFSWNLHRAYSTVEDAYKIHLCDSWDWGIVCV